METFRILVHLCFDAATALLYTASIALVTATATVVYSQRLAAGLLIAAISLSCASAGVFSSSLSGAIGEA